MYKFREVECPCCKHRFSWLEEPSGKSYYLYHRKGKDEELFSTKCPKCDVEMVVPHDDYIGIVITDERIKLSSSIRGI